MRKKWIIFIIALLVLFLLAGLFYYNSNQYVVVNPRNGDIIEAVYGLGKVKSNNRYEVILGVLSTVTERFVNEGEFVEKGDPLIKFDERVLFRAPFSGTVTYASLYQGETAIPHIPLLRIEDLRNRYIELSLEQQSVLRLKVGQPAKVSFESIRGKTFSGKVTAIFPKEDEFLTRVSVEGLDESILPGMTADVTIEIGSIHGATLIPLAAVRRGLVTVRKNGHWQKLKVEVGHVDGFSAEIKNNTLSLQEEIRMKRTP